MVDTNLQTYMYYKGINLKISNAKRVSRQKDVFIFYYTKYEFAKWLTHF